MMPAIAMSHLCINRDVGPLQQRRKNAGDGLSTLLLAGDVLERGAVLAQHTFYSSVNSRKSTLKARNSAAKHAHGT